jgi:hypothetical protein
MWKSKRQEVVGNYERQATDRWRRAREMQVMGESERQARDEDERETCK